MGTCSSWNIVSGGASRAFLEQADLIPDSPVVTINRAIDIMDRGIEVHFACFSDQPATFCDQLGLGKYLQPPIQVWVPRPAAFPFQGAMTIFDMVSRWEPYLPASVGMRTIPFGHVSSPDGKTKRFMFCLYGAIERALMFRPERIRVLCADMMGSWAPGLSEEECEMHQSELENARRDLSRNQRRVNETRGNDKAAVIQRDVAQEIVNALQRRGDPGIFKRWEHERNALKEQEKAAMAAGTKMEWVSPKRAVLA